MLSYAQEPAHRASRPAKPSKLRDSCHACALAKVKCHKEKPTCSRCARRGTTCKYFVTKRPGRKRENGDTINVVSHTLSPPGAHPSDWAASTSSLPTTTTCATVSGRNNYLTLLDLSPASQGHGSTSATDCTSTSDIFSGLLLPAGPTLSSAVTGVNTEYDDMFTSPIDLLDLDSFITDTSTQDQNDLARLLLTDDVTIDLGSITQPSLPKLPSSPSSDDFTRATSIGSGSGRRCQVQTLDLMRRLFAADSRACSIANSPDDSMAFGSGPATAATSQSPSAQTIVADNRQIVEIVGTMLRCSCVRDDGYVLIILSMVVLKMLGRYAAAVAAAGRPHQPPGGGQKILLHDSPSSSSSKKLDHPPEKRSGDEARLDTQLILSELHRVQQLINQLSPILKARETGAELSRKKPAACGDGCKHATGSGEEMAAAAAAAAVQLPFSPTMLNLLERDLRESLSKLSAETINMLRQA